MTKENVCRYHNVGYCKYKDKCKFLHSTEDCDKKCKRNTCLKRHRKICKHGDNCNHKQKCEFKHDQKLDANDQKSELKRDLNELLENKLKNDEKINLPRTKCKGNKSE